MKEFGVELLRRAPSPQEKFPYLTLRQSGGVNDKAGIILCQSSLSSHGIFGDLNPQSRTIDDLVTLINQVVDVPDRRPVLPDITNILRVFVEPIYEEAAVRFRNERNNALGVQRFIG